MKKASQEKLRRKAVLFSLISVLFSVLFITIFSQNFSTVIEDKIPGSNIRIKVMDTYVRNFEVYVRDSIKISSYNALNEITKYRDSHNGFFTNFDQFNATFHNCMMCGYVNCTNQTSNNNCNMSTNYLGARLDTIVQLSLQQLNINTTYSINSINIEQIYPFQVEVSVNISYNITDSSEGFNYAKWNRRTIITQPVTIIGLLDPIGYINDTTNRYNRTIKRYTGICQYDRTCWNYTTTQEFYQGYEFRYNKNSTSFLQRYWNDYSISDCCGIETIIHPSEISNINLNNSYIDQYYWNGTHTCENGNIIMNITLDSDEVHLDTGTALRYGLEDDGIVYCLP
jgi:hypothetical protein